MPICSSHVSAIAIATIVVMMPRTPLDSWYRILAGIFSAQRWGPSWIYILAGPQLYTIEEEADESEASETEVF